MNTVATDMSELTTNHGLQKIERWHGLWVRYVGLKVPLPPIVLVITDRALVAPSAFQETIPRWQRSRKAVLATRGSTASSAYTTLTHANRYSMAIAVPDPIATLRNPEYVGENRCLPCTVVNVIIAAVVGGGLGLLSPIGGLVVFLAALGMIYVRGYLVPGTPEFTQRYLPERVLTWFHDEPMPGGPIRNGDKTEPVELAELFEANRIAVPCKHEDDLCLNDRFRATWWRRIEQHRDEETAVLRLAARIEVDPAELALEETGRGEALLVHYEGDQIARWDSRGAFLADLAAELTLAEWIPQWDGLEPHERTELLVRLRVFLERCPSCDGSLSEIEDVRRTCCAGSITRVSTECENCGGVVFSGSYR